MFDLIAGTIERPLREPAPGSKATSLLIHGVILLLVISIPLYRATSILVEGPAMMAFMAMPAAPPPPPPPPPPPGRAAQPPAIVEPEIKKPETAAPIEVPDVVATTGTASSDSQVDGGVVGGVEGGVMGGVIGGVIGGLISSVAPPPPAPPPAPVRVGGQIRTPTLLHRFDPPYPDAALALHLTGVVILEATVDTNGAVQTVTVLRSRHRVLDEAAIDALRQWRYSPLVLNETATPFVLTVTFTFSSAARAR